jgi:hypothetical protein
VTFCQQFLEAHDKEAVEAEKERAKKLRMEQEAAERTRVTAEEAGKKRVEADAEKARLEKQALATAAAVRDDIFFILVNHLVCSWQNRT